MQRKTFTVDLQLNIRYFMEVFFVVFRGHSFYSITSRPVVHEYIVDCGYYHCWVRHSEMIDVGKMKLADTFSHLFHTPHKTSLFSSQFFIRNYFQHHLNFIHFEPLIFRSLSVPLHDENSDLVIIDNYIFAYAQQFGAVNTIYI